MSDWRPVGVFDSGVGGLTVVSELKKFLPGERIVYFGDTARVPYGTKSKETVTRFSVENTELLMKHDVKMVIVACNTASSLALEFLRRCFRVPIIGVIEPGARAAAKVTRNNRVGVIGTQATVNSGSYGRAIKKANPGIRLFAQSCPLFVPLVEEGWTDKAVTREIATIYLSGLKKSGIDTLIMGCTHYPLLKGVIRKALGERIALIDSAREVATEARDILDAAGLLNKSAKRGADAFYASDEPARFMRIGRRFLRRQIKCLKQPS
jgi:glutamate racemase